MIELSAMSDLLLCDGKKVHVLPREMLGVATFSVAVFLLRFLPLWVVDRILVVLAWLFLGDLAKIGITRPSRGPLELKNTRGRTPVLDIGALARIRSGDIEVVPGIRRLLRGGAELVDGRHVPADAVILATGYQSNVPQWLKVNSLINYYLNLLLTSIINCSYDSGQLLKL